MAEDVQEPAEVTWEDCADAIAGLLAHVDPTRFEWLLAIEVLAALDEERADQALALAHVYGPKVAAFVVGQFGFQLADVPDPLACAGCGVNVSFVCEFAYMASKATWVEAGDPDGHWCVGCLEGRLGRELVPADFDWTVPLTEWSDFPRSDRLRARMGHV